MRQGSASTKDRGEVRGSRRKIQPQKGTGRARRGDIKSPIFRGGTHPNAELRKKFKSKYLGGRVFGPKPRDFSTDLPKKIYAMAFRTALSHRFKTSTLTVVDKLVLPTHKTVGMRLVLIELGWHKTLTKGGSTLFVTALDPPSSTSTTPAPTTLHNNFLHSANMLRFDAGAHVMAVDKLTVHALLKHARVVIEHRALNWLINRYK